jgi:4-hydroxybenzoate polyprenyltransferase
MRKLLLMLEMIKFQHTLFALPFALLSFFYAAEGLQSGQKAYCLGFVLGAMVAARSAAMAFNRIVDARYDAANPRTEGRAIPKGEVSARGAWLFTAIMAAAFVGCAAMLNRLCLLLSPVALAVILGYSYSKRFTVLSHFWLGLSLAIAPPAAWIAARGTLDDPFPLLLAGAVLLWTAGFDVIYACQDVAFDRAAGLRSLPARLGVKGALRVSAALHALVVVALFALAAVAHLGAVYLGGCAFVAALLAYEHAIVKPDDLKRVNEAFFVVNAMVSLTVMATGLAELWR